MALTENPTLFTEDSVNAHGGLTGGRGKGIRNKEGEGNAHERDTPPPSRCLKHLHDENPPNCGRCKEARLLREAWDTEQQAPKARPVWCGRCDETTRQVELDDGRLARCPQCHPHRRTG